MLRCKLGWHRWDSFPTSLWLDEPLPHENRLGVVMEYRKCLCCNVITDATSFSSSRDSDLGVPNGLGPIAAKLVEEIMAKPGIPLPADPLPISD